ncbi:hypothetical protein GOP47_0022103 [Adiantum capillus-veneris]|uniref:Mitochondrial carrier protein n=1 Tax=Adiantum capillus-veneris TaxID=13818 RepID=A0A9D4UAQ9_ADICA|nr:hypothetical protein GOP47_0022103 [Adiantum capillus-veneris]
MPSESGAGGLLAKQMVAGGLAGMLADGVMYPMMTVKSRLQVQGASASVGSGGGASAIYMYRGPLHAIYTISAHEGWRTLYKGYATVSQIAPAQALYMASYQTAKKVLPGGKENPVVHFCGGVIATLVQSSVTVPVEVIRQRQMVQRSGGDSYKGSLHAATRIYKVEGVRALYRGFGLAQMVWGPYNAIYLPLWEASKRAAARYTGVDSVQKLEVQWELLSSFFSASCAAAITNPMDVVKTRLQVQGKSNASNSTNYTGALDAARSILRQEGVKGFACGISSRVFWIAPSSMIMFTCFDQLMKRL